MSDETNDTPRGTLGERHFERFELEGSAQHMAPSSALVALVSGLGLASEDVGAVALLGPGRLSVELDKRRSSRLTTPRDVAARVGHGRLLYRLSRESDRPAFPGNLGAIEVVIALRSAAANSALPGPSALVAALCERLDISAEDVGFALEGHDFLRVTLPLAAARALREHTELTIGAAVFAIEVASKKA